MALVQREDKAGVRTLTLTRPEVRNAINVPMLEELRTEFGALRRAGDVGAVILTGGGPAFCAGGDIGEMLAWRGKPLAGMGHLRDNLAGLVREIRALDQPIIAKINGDCVGAGLGLALACDLQYAAATARFGAPFLALGLVPDTALTFELPRRLGLSRAKELVFTAKLLQATEAWEAGLINQVVPGPDLDETVAELAQQLAGMPTRALGLAKRALQDGVEQGHAAALSAEAYLQALCLTTPEHAEGVKAFLEKRRPEFRKANAGA